VFSGVITPPEKEPKNQEVQSWVEDFLISEAGQKLLNQVGQPLHKQTTEEKEILNDETTLSDLLPQLTIASEWDSEGPNLHSNLSSPQSSEA
jgi:hypothetical protein